MPITRVEKSLGPWGWGLAGYEGAQLKIVLPKRFPYGRAKGWMTRPVTPAEVRQVIEAEADEREGLR